MATAPSVVVIGAGALGLCTAHHLVQRGATDVTVIDRGPVAGASSGLSVGIIETQYLDPQAIELRVRSMRFFGSLPGLDIVRNGYVRVAHSDADLVAFQRSAEIQRELGVDDATVLDRAQLGRLVPDMDVDDLAGGLYGPSDGYIDGHLFCSLLAEGLDVRANTELHGYERRGERHRLATSNGTFECDVVVNAAGGWAGEVGELLGAPIEILPERHRALVAHLPRELPYLMTSVMDYIPGSGSLGLYFRHEGPGRLIAGLHTEDVVPDAADFVEQVAERFARRLPGLADARLGDEWSGIYPMSPDGRPIVGPHPACDTIVSVAGAGGSGLQSSPALGALAADWIIREEAP